MKNKFSKNLIRTTSVSMAVCLSLSVTGCGAMSQSDDQNASVSTGEASGTADI
jgi:arabinogalactan endo-1,4-beta-galactosidase